MRVLVLNLLVFGVGMIITLANQVDRDTAFFLGAMAGMAAMILPDVLWRRHGQKEED